MTGTRASHTVIALPETRLADAAQTPATGRRLSPRTRLFYGFGSIAFGVKDSGFSYFLLIFYNQVMGLPASTVGLAIMIALFVDAFLDPIVGQISDNWRSKWGRRHPFMYAAALPVALSYLLLWNPPAGWSDQALFLYLIAVAILIRSFITLYEIPSAALAAELTSEYDERTRLLSYRYLFGWIGGLAMVFTALYVFLKPDEASSVGQLARKGYTDYGLAAGAVMFVAIMVSALGTHRQIPHLRNPPDRRLSLPTFVREMIGTLANGSFLAVLGSSLFNAAAVGVVFSMSLYFNTFFWEFDARRIALLTGANLLAAICAFVAAPALSRRFGKRNSAQALSGSAMIFLCAPIVLRLVDAFPPNGSTVLFPAIFLLQVFSTALAVSGTILQSSMIADVVEDSELRTGRRSEGLCFAAAAFVNKAVTGVGIFTSSALLAAIGFPAGAQPGQVSPEVVRNLGLVVVPTLAILYGLCVACLVGYRITRASHQASLQRLAAAADLVKEPEPPAAEGRPF